MKPQFPTVQEQINYWNEIERLEHERVMNIRAESPNERNETREGIAKEAVAEIEMIEGFDRCAPKARQEAEIVIQLAIDKGIQSFLCSPQIDASNPQEQASDTALTLDQTEATTDWFDSIADQEESRYHLRDEGTVDGEGESYAARNL